MNNMDLVLEALSKPYCHMVMDINKITNISKTEIKSILDKLIADDKVTLIKSNLYQESDELNMKFKEININIKEPAFDSIYKEENFYF